MANAKYSQYYTYIKPAIENKYVRSSVPYIFSIFTITILMLFAIRPTVSTILVLQKNLTDNQEVLQSLNNKADSLALAKKNYESIKPETKSKIREAVPDQPKVTTLISSLKDAAAKTASTSAMQIQPVTIIDYLSPASQTKLATGDVTFSYNIQGSFADIVSLLKGLSKAPRLITIDSLIISKQVEEKTTIMSINGKGYYLK